MYQHNNMCTRVYNLNTYTYFMCEKHNTLRTHRCWDETVE